MKRIISVLLTVVMLMSMFSMYATAEEGNPALYYESAGIEPKVSYWMNAYIHTSNDADNPYTYTQRNRQTGEYDYTFITDINITDYAIQSGHWSGFTFIPLMNQSLKFHLTYSFNTKSFMMMLFGMPGGNPDDGYTVLKEMKYELKTDHWYEVAVRFVGKVLTLYLDGVEMITFDFATVGTDVYDWDWHVKEQNDSLGGDCLFFCPVDVNFYMDNITVCSGDYDIATGTASEVYTTETEFTNLKNGVEAFGPFLYGDDNYPGAVPISYSADGGTEKVQYDRDFAANHTHEWVHDTANSSAVHCLRPGYNLYTCTCGASEQRDYVEPLGHLPGLLRSTPIQATETTSGVEIRTCNREGCFQSYTTIVPLTGTADKALHLYPNTATNAYNGYAQLTDAAIIAQDDGVAISMDIMPITHFEKDVSRIGAVMGASDMQYFIGYKYNVNKYVIEKDGVVFAESDATLPDYEWREWVFYRDGLNLALYIDGEEIVSTVMDEAIYTIIDGADDAYDDGEDMEPYFFVFQPYCTEYILDNVIVAGPDYDIDHKTGTIYGANDFSNLSDSGINGFGEFEAFSALAYDKNQKAGYKIESYGRPMAEIFEVHVDRAMKIDCDYDTGSRGGYAQLIDSEALIATDDAWALDFEYSFDFYAYDWCTDTEKMGEYSAMIGGSLEDGDGFIGYDFIKQQAVIGSIASHSGGAYGADNSYADYTIEKNTWHNYKFKYYYQPGENAVDEGTYLFSIYIDGKEVLTKDMGGYMKVLYYIMFPTFVKGYLDNVTVKLGGEVLDDGYDFSNDYGDEIASMSYSGTDWSLVDGGTPVHVYDTVVYPASCVTDGYTIYTCTCGDGGNYTAYDQPASGHSWNSGVVTTEPTVDTEGVMTYTCGICGETKTEAIEKLAPEYTPGDVNDDGRIQASDQSTFGRALSGASITINAKAADANADGRVQANDLNMLARRLSGASIELG